MFAFYSLRLNFGNSISGTELRGCLFVPAAFTSSRSCVGDRTATENGDWVVQPHWLGLHSGGGQLGLLYPEEQLIRGGCCGAPPRAPSQALICPTPTTLGAGT